MSDTKLLHTSLIRVDGGTQMRAELDPATIAEYAQARQAGATFPPIVVYYDGETYWLGDGFHRLAACKKLFEGGIQCEVRSGTRRDAVLCAAGANAAHGLRRTNADKRRSVEALLRDEEWSQWSDREIGRRCGVSNQFVSNIRSELSVNGGQTPTARTAQRNGQTYTMNTAAIAAANEGRRHLPAQPTQTYHATLPVAPSAAPVAPVAEPVEAIHIPSHTTKEITEDLDNAIRRAVSVYQGDSERWQAMSAAGASDKEIMQRLAQSIRSQGGSSGPEWYHAEHLVYKGGPCIRISRNMGDTLPVLVASGQDLIDRVRKAWSIPQPITQSSPRILTTPETEAVIWRAIQRSGHTTPAEQIKWLILATTEDFRKLLNPGVAIDPELLTHRHRMILAELKRQVDTAPAPSAKADPTPLTYVSQPEAAPAPAPIVADPDQPDEKPDGDEYYTPPYIAEAARQVLGHIDLDPASSALAQTVIKAAHYYTKEEDGLTKPWAGTVWLNPPYSCPAPFVAKLIEEHEAGNVTAAILLVNTGTETQWGQSLLNRYLVCFVGAHGGRRSRIAFWRDDPTQPDNRNRYSQMIFYIGNQPEQFIAVFQQFGAILEANR